MPVHYSTVVSGSLSALSVYLLLLLLSTSTRGQAPMEHEPVEHLKAHLPKRGDDISGKLELFLQARPEELKRKTVKMESNLRKVLKDEAHVSAFLVKGSTVLAQKTAEGIQFNSTILLPHAILLPILSTTLPILMEGYKPELLTKPMGTILKGKHREHSNVKDYLSFSLHDLTTKLPQSGNSVDLDSPTLLSELNRRGKAAFHYLNTVLESVAEDAWKDALISVAMDSSVFSDKGQMLTHFKDLVGYAEALGSDIINFFEVSKSDLYPVDGGHFLYGWWFNCPRGGGKGGSKESRCLAPFLPSNAMAMLHTVIRVYTVPRLNLHLLVANTDKSAGAPRSLSDVLAQDKLIWNALYSVVDPSLEKNRQEGKKEKKKEKDSEKETPTKSPVKAEETQQPTEETAEPPVATDDGAQPQVKTGDDSSKEAPPPVAEETTQPPEASDSQTKLPPDSEEKIEPPTEEIPTETPKTEPLKPTDKEMPTELPEMAGETEPLPQDTPPSAEPTAPTPVKDETPTSETRTKAATEDEVVGDSMPRKKPTSPSAGTGSQPPPPPPAKRGEEDEVVEENVRDKKPGRREGGTTTERPEKAMLVWVIYKSWPITVFLFYTILSHVWVYWIFHLLWLVCSTLFSGIYLPRPKTAKTD